MNHMSHNDNIIDTDNNVYTYNNNNKISHIEISQVSKSHLFLWIWYRTYFTTKLFWKLYLQEAVHSPVSFVNISILFPPLSHAQVDLGLVQTKEVFLD